jgi:type IV secretion system protein VirB6
MDKGKIKIFLKFLLFFLFVQNFYFTTIADADDCSGIADNFQGSCIMAYDYGFSTGSIIIKSNCKIDSNGNDKCKYSKDPKCGECQWKKFDPEFFTKGNTSMDSNANNIAITVEGGWKPWGDLEIAGKYCKFNICNESTDSNCYSDGKKIDPGIKQANLPCCIKDGYGIYGLIALNGQDPNNYPVLGDDNFRTFRVGPLKEKQYKPGTSSGGSSDPVTIKTYVVDHVEKLDIKSQSFTQEKIPAGGLLYFKIEDSYYRDNVGSYKIKIDNGAFIKKVGYIEQLIDFFKATFKKVEKVISENIVQEYGFRTVVRALLVLFVIFTVIFFMLGLIEINQTELIVRLFKIGIISTVISDSTFHVIPDLFQGIIDATIDISTVIMKASMFDQVNNIPLLPFPELNTVFSAYDDVIEMVTSKAFNVKIWGILFTNKFYLIIGVYICIVLMFMGMWRSLVQYIMSFFLLALLIILLPIFIVSILFKQTIHLFDNWLEQFIGSCVMLIVVTATVALMLSLIITQLQDLLYYTVCWSTIFSWELLGITIIDFKFWKASNASEFSDAVTPIKFFYVLISSVLFRVYMDYVPELVDALGGVAKKPLSGMYTGAMGTFDSFVQNMKNELHGSRAYQFLDVKLLSPIQQRMGLLHYVDKASNKILGTKKEGVLETVLLGKDGLIKSLKSKEIIGSKDHKEWKQFGNKKADPYDVQGIWSRFTGDIHGDLGVYDYRKEQRKADASMKDLRDEVSKFAQEFAKLRESLKSENKDEAKENRDLMQKMISGDKKILDKSTKDLDVKYEQLKGEKGKILGSKELLENKLSDIEGKQSQLDQKGSDLTLERRSLDDIQRNDADLMQLKDQRDPLDVNKVEERYQELLKERFGDKENAIAEKQQLLETEKLSLVQERELAEKQYQQEAESYQNSIKEFEENRNLAQQQYELHEEQQRVLDGGISKYEIEDGLNRTQEQMDQTVGLFQEKQGELSNSQTHLEEQLRQLDELNKKLEQENELAKQLAQELQKNKDQVTDETEASQLKLNDALESRYVEQQSHVEQLQTQVEEGREVYNQDLEFQTQEYNKYSEDMARAQEEVVSTQLAYDQQKSEMDDYRSSVQDKWASDDLYLEPQSQQVAPDIVPQEHTETAMDKIMKIQEESKIYQEKMDRMKKLEEEIFEESRRIK